MFIVMCILRSLEFYVLRAFLVTTKVHERMPCVCVRTLTPSRCVCGKIFKGSVFCIFESVSNAQRSIKWKIIQKNINMHLNIFPVQRKSPKKEFKKTMFQIYALCIRMYSKNGKSTKHKNHNFFKINLFIDILQEKQEHMHYI